jgi:hypothetical protein
MLKLAYETIKARDPNIVVISGAYRRPAISWAAVRKPVVTTDRTCNAWSMPAR